ncbi:hypothetical protein AKJ16_DCAP22338 [Drosera capensis]
MYSSHHLDLCSIPLRARLLISAFTGFSRLQLVSPTVSFSYYSCGVFDSMPMVYANGIHLPGQGSDRNYEKSRSFRNYEKSQTIFKNRERILYHAYLAFFELESGVPLDFHMKPGHEFCIACNICLSMNIDIACILGGLSSVDIRVDA